MSENESSQPVEIMVPEDLSPAALKTRSRREVVIKALVLLIVFVIGGGSGYLVGDLVRNAMSTSNSPADEHESMVTLDQINPPEGYTIPAIFGDVGPQMVAAGAINVPMFEALYAQQNKPLSDEQTTILTRGSEINVLINSDNAYFLLNFFWALGLTNQNIILTKGAMMSQGADKVGGFASTGGWTLGSKRATELYASRKILELTDEQQARLQEVASVVYRPCCNNPTDFPDCNHGMAMLGLLELMASQNASTAQMYEAAKYVNAFWYPQQILEVATVIKATQNVDFVKADAKEVASSQYSSGSGYQAVHQWLAAKGLLPQTPGGGGSCGVG